MASIERDLGTTQSLLLHYQDNTFLLPQIDQINSDLGTFMYKKKKEKEMYDKIQAEEEKEQNLFEKARTFNTKVVDHQLQAHFERSTQAAV